MATTASDDFAPITAALATLQSTDRSQKAQAHDFLEKFQKSSEAWTATHSMLSSAGASVEAKLFAATTLKGKITYDLDQLPRQSLESLRSSILNFIINFRDGPKPIRTQLCVCLANLAIQMIEWDNVLELVGSTLGSHAGDCLLEFLKVLPEEVTEGRRIHLTDDELASRTKKLLTDNAPQVLGLLTRYSQSSAAAASNPQLFSCISSWLREVPAADVVNSPLFETIVNALSLDAAFESANECMSEILSDTREVDESIELIYRIYPRILSLRPRLVEAADSEDLDTFKGLTRLFAEAGEVWVVMIARLPNEFRALVETILECCARDRDRDAIAQTFTFWNEFKQMITLEHYKEARAIFSEVFARLVDVMIKHLEFPSPEVGKDEADLFDGDREQEERFREFRHQIGDVLKDCCEVIGVKECLKKAFLLIQQWISTWASQATNEKVPHWQELEAPIFAMRAMGRNVSPEESTILRQVIPLIVQIPDHEKLRFQAIMALGRYTEWTAQHPEFLQSQLNFVIAGFQHSSKEVIKAAALAFRFFGSDCRKLLVGHVTQLHDFYESVLDKIPIESKEELTEGVSTVISAQPLDNLYPTIKLYCDPIIKRLMATASVAKESGSDDKAKLMAVGECLQILTIYVQNIQPYVSPGEEHPAVKYCQEILPIMSTIAENFTSSTPILERICRCWRYMVLSYRTAVLPLLPTLARQLASGFENSREGCFLWATDAVLREFAVGAEFIDASTSQAIYNFFEQQALAFLRIMNDLPPSDLPDVIEDFFHLLMDALIYYHQQLIPAAICQPIISASLSALTLEQQPPLTTTLHFLLDFLSYGTDHPNSSSFDEPSQRALSPHLKEAVKRLASSQGEILTQRILTGMMFHFPRDCFADASGVLLGLFEILPQDTALWVKKTLDMLPPGSVRPGEADRLMEAIGAKIQAGDLRRVRVLMQDYTTSYRRRNVAPRDGLGRLEATRFRFRG